MLENLYRIICYANLVIDREGKINYAIATAPEIIQHEENLNLLAQVEREALGFNLYYSLFVFYRKKFNNELTTKNLHNQKT